jgi:hypothetical protein
VPVPPPSALPPTRRARRRRWVASAACAALTAGVLAPPAAQAASPAGDRTPLPGGSAAPRGLSQAPSPETTACRRSGQALLA